MLDATQLVPEELCPVRTVGRMVLDRNPDQFFAETEQVAFCTAHVVPGIDFTNDPLLAGRHHSVHAKSRVVADPAVEGALARGRSVRADGRRLRDGITRRP